jgi:hypothetical protein
MKLYSSKNHPEQWIAYVPGAGWFVFPHGDNGWEQRKPARGIDPIHLRQAPLSAAARTGLTENENQPELQEVG